MISFLEYFQEALKPSQYRQYVKGWNKARFEDIFLNPKYERDRRGYRVYLPLKKAEGEIRINPDVRQFVQDKGYEISDYKAGLASKNNRVIKIGKLLDDPEIKKLYDNDPARQAQAEYEVVISRHPYDIAGMSTDRGWTSCMNLKDGSNKEYVALDVKEGTLVAYLIKKGDRDIKRPVARIAIKPFVNVLAADEIAFGIENAVYGTDVPGFTSTVKDWVNYVNKSKKLNGVFVLSPSLYNDTDPAPKKFGKYDPDMLQVQKDPESIARIKNPSEEVQLAAVRLVPSTISYIKNPTEAVQIAAVTDDPDTIQYIKKPSEEVQLAAIAGYPGVIRLIKKPSEKVQLAAITKFPGVISSINNVSEKVLIAAVSKNGNTIQYIRSPSEDVQLAAVKQNKRAIRYIDKPTAAVKALAAKK